jgi:hypothetical protein
MHACISGHGLQVAEAGTQGEDTRAHPAAAGALLTGKSRTQWHRHRGTL